MSGTLPSGRYLRSRVGPVVSPRRQQFRLLSTITVIFELMDRQTGQLVSAAGFSAIAYRPNAADFGTQIAPATIVSLGPGQWEVSCPSEMLGEYTIFATALGSTVATHTAIIDVI